VPALGALIAEPLFLLADTAIVSHLGTAPLAGLGTAAAALATLVNVCVFLAYGTTATTARRLGEGDMVGAMRSGIAGVALAAGLGLALALVGLSAAGPIVRWLGVPGASAGYATTYLRISSLGLPSMLIVLAGTGLLRGLANTRTPLVVAGCGAVANAALNYLLVYPAGLGIAGSALGTVLTQTAMAAAYLRIIQAAGRGWDVRLAPHLGEIRRNLGTNVALLIRTVALRAYLLVAVWAAGRLGTTALAAHTVASNVWNLMAMALDALAIAAQALVGHALGAGQDVRARQLLSRLTRWGVCYGLVTGALLLAVFPLALRLMSSDGHVRGVLVPVVLIMALFQPVAGAVFVLDGVLIGAGDSSYLAWSAMACTAVFVAGALPVALRPMSLTYLWWAVGGLMIVRLLALGIRARGAAWLTAGMPGSKSSVRSSRSATREVR
jgi:putative MATE family efflux protein